jgi:hypothetical protein
MTCYLFIRQESITGKLPSRLFVAHRFLFAKSRQIRQGLTAKGIVPSALGQLAATQSETPTSPIHR